MSWGNSEEASGIKHWQAMKMKNAAHDGRPGQHDDVTDRLGAYVAALRRRWAMTAKLFPV